MSEMLEKAARAVTFVPLWAAPDGRNVVASPELAAEIVRTVLMAIREPGEPICEAGAAASVDVSGNMADFIGIGASKAGRVFTAMIDEVLK